MILQGAALISLFSLKNLCYHHQVLTNLPVPKHCPKAFFRTARQTITGGYKQKNTGNHHGGYKKTIINKKQRLAYFDGLSLLKLYILMMFI